MTKLRRWTLVFLAGLCCVAASSAWAGTLAGTLPVQGVLRTSAGGAVADGTYTLKVSLYDQATGGAPIWKDTFGAVAVVGGLFAFELGGDSGSQPLPSVLTSTATPLWFGISIGADPELPRTAIGWVPRAFWANVAGVAQAVGCTGCIGAEQIANGSIGADKVGFNYAASAGPGGAATSALTASTADTAVSAQTAASADVAKDLQCSGCVGLSDLSNDVKGAFVATTGDSTITGNVTENGLLTVNGVFALGGSFIIGGIYGDIGLCNAANAGKLGWGVNSARFQICDGTALRNLAECRDQCQDASKVTCGAAIPDICGDTKSGCTGTGTLCTTAGQQCADTGTGLKCQAIPTSCLAIAGTKAGQPDATYFIDPDGVGGEAPISAWCDLNTTSATSTPTAAVGGWTLVMKIDGTKDTFLYDNPLWTNKVALNPGAFAFNDTGEFKSSAFWTLPFTSIRILMSTAAVGGQLTAPGQELQISGGSLYELFASGVYRPTYLGRAGWKALMPSTSLLANCNLEGVNARAQDNQGSSNVRPRVRLGILTNNETDCASVDSWIGVGEQGFGCQNQAIQHAAGNSCAVCGCDGNNASLTAFTYIYVR